MSFKIANRLFTTPGLMSCYGSNPKEVNGVVVPNETGTVRHPDYLDMTAHLNPLNPYQDYVIQNAAHDDGGTSSWSGTMMPMDAVWSTYLGLPVRPVDGYTPYDHWQTRAAVRVYIGRGGTLELGCKDHSHIFLDSELWEGENGYLNKHNQGCLFSKTLTEKLTLKWNWADYDDPSGVPPLVFEPKDFEIFDIDVKGRDGSEHHVPRTAYIVARLNSVGFKKLCNTHRQLVEENIRASGYHLSDVPQDYPESRIEITALMEIIVVGAHDRTDSIVSYIALPSMRMTGINRNDVASLRNLGATFSIPKIPPYFTIPKHILAPVHVFFKNPDDFKNGKVWFATLIPTDNYTLEITYQLETEFINCVLTYKHLVNNEWDNVLAKINITPDASCVYNDDVNYISIKQLLPLPQENYLPIKVSDNLEEAPNLTTLGIPCPGYAPVADLNKYLRAEIFLKCGCHAIINANKLKYFDAKDTELTRTNVYGLINMRTVEDPECWHIYNGYPGNVLDKMKYMGMFPGFDYIRRSTVKLALGISPGVTNIKTLVMGFSTVDLLVLSFRKRNQWNILFSADPTVRFEGEFPMSYPDEPRRNQLQSGGSTTHTDSITKAPDLILSSVPTNMTARLKTSVYSGPADLGVVLIDADNREIELLPAQYRVAVADQSGRGNKAKLTISLTSDDSMKTTLIVTKKV